MDKAEDDGFVYDPSQVEQVYRIDGEHFAEIFSNFCNDMRRGPKKYAVERMLQDHRTIQQNMMKFCLQFIEGMSQQQHDLRNEASVELAKAIMALPDRVRILPYI